MRRRQGAETGTETVRGGQTIYSLPIEYRRGLGRWLVPCCVLLALAACEAPLGPELPVSVPTTIEVTPDVAILPIDGGTVQLTAIVRDQHGDTIEGTKVEWLTTNVPVANVDKTGFVTAYGDGSADIVAKYETLYAVAEVVVSDDPDRYSLTRFYHATGGPDWSHNDNWLGVGPLSDWYGVHTDSGRVFLLDLAGNGLAGEIPGEIGSLSRLLGLSLGNNELTGPVSSSIGRLKNLQLLFLENNNLGGLVPAQLGESLSLISVRLSGNPLQGLLPESMTQLWLGRLDYRRTGLCAPRRAGFQRWLSGVQRVEAQPCTASQHDRLVLAELYRAMDGSNWTRAGGWLTDAELGEWAGVSVDDSGRVAALDLKDNLAAGKLPHQLAYLDGLTRLDVSGNTGLRGILQKRMTELDLEAFHFADTGVCAPPAREIAEWLDTMGDWSGWTCAGARSILARMPVVYMTQPVQTRDAAVPLIAGRDALARVFVVADSVNYFDSDVRVSFYRGRRIVHVATMTAEGRRGIPLEVDEGRVEATHQALIPGEVLFPGVEMVVELDPGVKLPLRRGSQRRVPGLGRIELDVREVPKFKMTIVPVQYEGADTSLAAGASRMTARSQAVRETLNMLPVSDYDFSVRETFHVSPGTNLLREINLLRVADGDPGYYVGIISDGGVAYLPGRASLSDTTTGTMAHEFGHNMSLRHAPCGGAFGPDPDFPHAGGRTGAWGHDRETGTMWSPATPEIMSYCRDLGYWISDFHYVKAFEYRLYEEEEWMEASARLAAGGHRRPSLVLWGRTGPDGVTLDPAIVVDAVPSLPTGGGRYRIEGQAARGGPLFALRFDPQIEAESGEEHFVFTLPVDAAWAGSLASIIVSGPNGSDRLDATVSRPIAVVTDRATGRIRKLLRDFETAPVAGPGEVVTVSRGLPDKAALMGRR